jgi:hypothetical protein
MIISGGGSGGTTINPAAGPGPGEVPHIEVSAK